MKVLNTPKLSNCHHFTSSESLFNEGKTKLAKPIFPEAQETSSKIKKLTFAKSADPDATAHNEPPHLDQRCLNARYNIACMKHFLNVKFVIFSCHFKGEYKFICCCCNPILVIMFPEQLSSMEPWPRLVVFVVFCVHMNSFPHLIMHKPPLMFRDTAIPHCHSVTLGADVPVCWVQKNGTDMCRQWESNPLGQNSFGKYLQYLPVLYNSLIQLIF